MLQLDGEAAQTGATLSIQKSGGNFYNFLAKIVVLTLVDSTLYVFKAI